jgi:hypothetical protein
MTAERTIFTLRIAGKPGQAGVRQLRALLKELLRRHKFTCLHAEEEHFTRGSSPKRRRTKTPGARGAIPHTTQPTAELSET